MKKLYSLLLTGILVLIYANVAFGQQPLVSADKKKELDAISVKANSLFVKSQQQAFALARSKGWILSRRTKKGGIQVLQGINRRGFPIYFTTDDNVISAATTSTNTVQPGGSLGLNLSGSSSFLNNKLAVWDGGAVYRFHQEFSGKTITIADTSSIIDHATHVAGTMLAKGVYPPVKGMAFNASTLLSYDFNNDVAEMSAAAHGYYFLTTRMENWGDGFLMMASTDGNGMVFRVIQSITPLVFMAIIHRHLTR